MWHASEHEASNCNVTAAATTKATTRTTRILSSQLTTAPRFLCPAAPPFLWHCSRAALWLMMCLIGIIKQNKWQLLYQLQLSTHLNSQLVAVTKENKYILNILWMKLTLKTILLYLVFNSLLAKKSPQQIH